MTRDEIIRMAREARFERLGTYASFGEDWVGFTESLEAFAALVAAAEREDCAKVCEEHTIPSELANAIRNGAMRDARLNAGWGSEQQAEPVAREGFEKWAKSLPNYMDISRFETGYSDCNTDYAWVGWQAALAQPQQQAEPPPEWPLIKNILDEYGLQAIDFVADWKAAQRPWVGLTPEEVKHLYPYGRSIWGKETFEAIEKALKAKNNG